MTIYGKRRWYRRLAMSVRRHTLYWALIGVGLLLMATAGAAAAAITLSGKGTLVAPAYHEKMLQVTDERLSRPLTPGGAADLLFAVRNPNAFPVRVDGVSLASAMSRAKPAGCTAKVSGPVRRGFVFPAADRVTVPAGGRSEVRVPDAFRLARSALRGCGFTVDILVSATQGAGAPPASTPAPPVPPVPPDPPAEPGPSVPVTEPATTTAPTSGSSEPDPADSTDLAPPPLIP